jgi:hypothetical protein
MDLFSLVSFIHDEEVRSSDLAALFEEFFGVGDIMDRCGDSFRPVIICQGVSTEIEVFWNRFLVFPFLQK